MLMKKSKGMYVAGIVITLLAAAVMCLAAAGYRDYSESLLAERELAQIKQSVKDRENELDDLVAQQESLEEQSLELSEQTGQLQVMEERYRSALSMYEEASDEIGRRTEKGDQIMKELAAQQEVRRLRECAFSMNYEEEDGKLTLENGLTIFNEGVDRRYPALCALYLNYVPRKLLDKMAEDGWVIRIIPGATGTGTYRGESETYAGTTYYDDRKIDIGVDEDEDIASLTVRNTILHEVAHVLDSYEDYASYKNSFIACYQKEKSLFHDTKWNDNEEYAARTATEFYAEVLMAYWMSPDYVKYNCSDTFEYFENMSVRWADEPTGVN